MDSTILKTVLITGANRGIGLAIAEGFAKDIRDFQVIITSREKSKADEAANQLMEKYPTSKGRIFGVAADIGESATITQLKEYIQQTFGSLDLLINNAGVLSWTDLDPKEVEYTINVNVIGTFNITEELLPLVNQKGKIINLGSSAGCWGKFARTNKAIFDKLFDEKNSTEDLKNVALECVNDVKNNTYEGKWVIQRNAYAFSKLLINLYSRNLSFRSEIKSKEIQVYAVCPGWCKTDMGGDEAGRTADDGADTVLYLSSLPFEVNEKLQGKFIRDREQVDWEISPNAHDN